MRLSTNFTLEEFTRSQTAIRQNIDNTPTEEHSENLKLLCEMVLQPVRDHFGPIAINSGYRGVVLNKTIALNQTERVRGVSSGATGYIANSGTTTSTNLNLIGTSGTFIVGEKVIINDISRNCTVLNYVSEKK